MMLSLMTMTMIASGNKREWESDNDELRARDNHCDVRNAASATPCDTHNSDDNVNELAFFWLRINVLSLSLRVSYQAFRCYALGLSGIFFSFNQSVIYDWFFIVSTPFIFIYWFKSFSFLRFARLSVFVSGRANIFSVNIAFCVVISISRLSLVLFMRCQCHHSIF